MNGSLEGMDQETLKRMRSSPGRGSPQMVGNEEDTRPYEARFTGTGRAIPLSEAKERGRVPSREELQKYPRTVLLRIAIELEPDAVSESYQEGWTKDDILRVIERHIKDALGNQSIEGWPYVHGVEIIDSEIEENQEPEASSPYEEL